jgi:hypothetical protein
MSETPEELQVVYPIPGKGAGGPVRLTPKEAAAAVKAGTHATSEDAASKAARVAARPADEKADKSEKADKADDSAKS